MPRTKALKIHASKLEEGQRKLLLGKLKKMSETFYLKIEAERNEMIKEYRAYAMELKVSIPEKYLNMTLSDVMNAPSNDTVSVSCISKDELLSITKNSVKGKRQLKRSSSLVEDEGYLTAESVTSGTGTRMSRSRAKNTSTRTTRSLSRNHFVKPAIDNKTPTDKHTLQNTYGLVTPKCKPNTPQILLRRPKNGELALSIQGSPLYTGCVVQEETANINIPLAGGRMLTLQPQRGLRVSQIPEFDAATRDQLEKLRENLFKVLQIKK